MAGRAAAQGGDVSAALPVSVAPVGTSAGPADIVIPALTPVKVEFLTTLGSQVSKTGDSFPIRLAEPIIVDGKELIPAGAPGMGEVIHAKKSGGGGSAGELVLAARYLQIGEQRVRLRSLRMAPTGRSNINTVNSLTMASTFSPYPVALLGFFITGGKVLAPQGTIADAKTAEITTLTPLAGAEQPAAAQGDKNDVP